MVTLSDRLNCPVPSIKREGAILEALVLTYSIYWPLNKPSVIMNFWAILSHLLGSSSLNTPWCQASAWIVMGTCWSLLDPCLAHPAVTSLPASVARTVFSAPVPTYRAGLVPTLLPALGLSGAGRLLWLTGESWVLTHPFSNLFCRASLIATNGKENGRKGRVKGRKFVLSISTMKSTGNSSL